MALMEDLTKSAGGSVLLGLGIAIAAPVILPALGTGLRPLVKAVVRGGIMVYDTLKETVAEAGEQLSDIVAEVRSESTHSDGSTTGTAATEAGKGRSDRRAESEHAKGR